MNQTPHRVTSLTVQYYIMLGKGDHCVGDWLLRIIKPNCAKITSCLIKKRETKTPGNHGLMEEHNGCHFNMCVKNVITLFANGGLPIYRVVL